MLKILLTWRKITLSSQKFPAVSQKNKWGRENAFQISKTLSDRVIFRLLHTQSHIQ